MTSNTNQYINIEFFHVLKGSPGQCALSSLCTEGLYQITFSVYWWHMPWHMSVKMITIIFSENKSFKFYWLYNFLLWQIIILLYFDFVLWIYSYLWNHCLSPLKLRVRIPLMARCTRYNKVCQWLVTCRWFSPVSAFRSTWAHPRFLVGFVLLDL